MKNQAHHQQTCEDLKFISYCSFDKMQVEQNLFRQKNIIELKLSEIQELCLGVRKHKLRHENVKDICNNLLDKSGEIVKIKYLCRLLKYLIRNGSDISLETLTTTLKSSKESYIQQEIALLICEVIQIQQSNNNFNQKDILQVQEIIKNEDICKEVKQILNHQLYLLTRQNSYHQPFNSFLQFERKPNFMKQRVAEKYVQQVKLNLKNTNSEEQEINISNTIQNLLNSRQKKHYINNNTLESSEIQEIPVDIIGSDLPKMDKFFNTYWFQIRTFYNLVQDQDGKNKKAIKSYDKDEFLPNAFLKDFDKYSNNVVETYFIQGILDDRIIASIFKKISKYQKLNNQTIQKLIKCFDGINEKKFDINKVVRFCCQLTSQTNGWQKEKRTDIEEQFLSKVGEFFQFTNGSFLASRFNEDYDLKKSKVNNDILQEAVQNEIILLRTDAIIAFYHQVQHDHSILTQDIIYKLETLLKEKDINNELKKYVRKIYMLTKQGSKSKDLLIDQLTALENCVDVNEQVNQILIKSKDQINSSIFFDSFVILRIIKLHYLPFTLQTKLIFCQIINNILSHTSSNGLTHESLISYFQIFEKYVGFQYKIQEDNQIKKEILSEILMSILFTQEKQQKQNNQKTQNELLATLFYSYEKVGDDEQNMIMLILFHISVRQNISSSLIYSISKKILSDSVIVRENDKIKFEKLSSENDLNYSVSAIACQILYNQLQIGVKIDEGSLNNLVKALEKQDKQTKICSAKCLYLSLTLLEEVDNSLLIKLKEYLEDDVFDVKVYIMLAYSRGLVILSQKCHALSSFHIEQLLELFCFDKLVLVDQDFSEKINNDVIKVFLNESKKQKFTLKVFSFLDQILTIEEQKTQESVLNIIDNQIPYFWQQQFPENITIAIESAIYIDTISEKAFLTLERLISNGQEISANIISEYVNDVNNKEERRWRSFYILDQINRNSDLSVEIFNRIELERASLSVERNYEDQQYALQYLLDKTNEGEKLSFFALKGLSILVDNQQVQTILLNVQSNRQVLPQQLADRVLEIFNPQKEEKLLFDIIQNILNSSRAISQQFLSKLQEGLSNHVMFEKVLSAFATVSIYSDIPDTIITLISDTFINTKNEILQSKLSSSICSMASRNYELYKILSQSLRYGLSIKRKNINIDIINTYKIINDKSNAIDQECKESLLQKLLNCNKQMKDSIISILKTQDLNKQQITILNEVNLSNFENNEDILQFLQSITSLDDFNEQEYFEKINLIFRQSKYIELHSKIINEISKYNKLYNIPDFLIDTIINIIIKTNEQNLLVNCCQLIIQAIQANKVIKSASLLQLSMMAYQKDVLNAFQIISESQQLPQKVTLIIQIVNLSHDSSADDFNNLLDMLSSELIQGLNLPDFCINKLFQADKILQKSNLYQKKLVDVLAIAYLENNNNSQKINRQTEKQIIKLIELSIEQKIITNNNLKCYYQIIKNQKLIFYKLIKTQKVLYSIIRLIQCSIKQTNTSNDIRKYCYKLAKMQQFLIQLYSRKLKSINSLHDFLQNNNNENLNEQITINILLCLSAASEYLKLPQSILNTFLDHLSNMKTKGIVIKGLTTELNKSHFFQFKLSQMLEDFSDQLNQKIEYNQDLIESLFLNAGKLQLDIHSQQELWPKQILISHINQLYNLDENYVTDFEERWIIFEKNSNYKNKQNLQLQKDFVQCLNQNEGYLNFNQACDMVLFLQTIDSIIARGILLTDSDPYNKLKYFWVNKQVRKYFEKVSEQYVIHLSSRITKNKYLSCDIIQQILTQLNIDESISSFEELLLDFIETHQITEFPVIKKNMSLIEFVKQIELNLLINLFKFKKQQDSILRLIEHLFLKNWKFDQLRLIIQKSQQQSIDIAQQVEEKLIDVLKMIDQFSLSSDYHEEIMNIFDIDFKNWLKQVNHLIIKSKSYIPDGRKKERNDIKREFEQNNICAKESLELFNSTSSSLEMIQKNMQILFFTINDINQLKPKDILDWVNEIKIGEMSYRDQNFKDFITEAVLIANRAIYLSYGFEMNENQKLACVASLNKQRNKGRFIQIGTGEGKTIVISVVATILALQNMKVDIITSNSDLAKRDAREQAKLYKMFSLSCADNTEQQVKGTSTTKACYKCDIVYGDTKQFQFDHLTHQKFFTFGNRKCEFIIIDEVDCSFIDERASIAKLSFKAAGIDNLHIIYSCIWYHISTILESDNFQGSEEDIQDELKKVLQEKIINNQIQIPNAYKEFVEQQFPNWISNAILAYNIYQENIHYIIQDGQIKPVDFQNTGVVLDFTHWSQGLHQFLQLKHQLKLSSENFTTNFISNDGFFKKYNSSFIGFSATLGSEKIRKLIEDQDNLDTFIIPSQFHSQFKSLPPILTSDHKEWLDQICKLAINECYKERGVLIVCESIRDVYQIEDELKNKYSSSLIKCYKMNNKNEELFVKKINKGEIIISTNLGGRGTDIKIDGIKENGGMHVILTYLPLTGRVQTQIMGRSGRQGKSGTGQMVLNSQLYQHRQENQVEKIIKQRDDIEFLALEKFIKNQLKQIKKKDEYYTEYCKLILQIRKQIKQQYGINYFVYEEYILKAIELQWAFFLIKDEDENYDLNILQNKETFNMFTQRMLLECEQKKVIKNNFYYINISNILTFNQNRSKNNQQKEECYNLYDKAIDLDYKESAAAFIGKGFLMLQEKEQNKKQIRQNFKKAYSIITEYIPKLNAIYFLQQNNQNQAQFQNEQLLLQTEIKTNIFAQLCSNLKQNMQTIKQSQRLIDMKCIKSNEIVIMKNLQKFELLTKLDDIKYEKYSICFNNLTCSSDIFTNDQYVKTIEQALKVDCNIQTSILFKKIQFLHIKNFFYPHLVYNCVKKKQVLRILQDAKNSRDINLDIYQDSLRDFVTFKHKSSKELTQLIESDYQEDKYYFNITILDGNQKYQEFKKKADNPELNIEFYKLDEKKVNQLLQCITSSMVCVEIIGKTVDLLNISQYLTNEIQYFNKQDQSWEIKETKLIVNQLKDTDEQVQHQIKIYSNIDQIKNIVDNSKSCSYNLEFFNFSIQDFANIIFIKDHELVTASISINSTSKEQVLKSLISHFRKEMINFSIQFSNLNKQQVKIIVEGASVQDERIDVKIKPLSIIFLDDNQPLLELSELKEKGIEYLIQLNERKPLPIFCMIAVGVLAICQIAVGIAFSYTKPGEGLLLEGIFDIISLGAAIYTREFSWKNYIQQKTGSLVLSLVQIGYSRFYNKCKVLYKQGVQSAQFSKQLLFSTAKNAIYQKSPMIINEIMQLNIENIEQYITQSIQSQVNCQFNQTKNFDLLINKLYALEKLGNAQLVQEEIKKLAQEVIVHDIKRDWELFYGQLCSNLFSNTYALGNFSAVQRIYSVIDDISNIVNRVFLQLAQRLSDQDQQEYSIASLLEKNKVNKISALNIIQILKDQQIVLTKEVIQSEITFEYLNPLSISNQLGEDVDDSSSHKPLLETKKIIPQKLLSEVQFGMENEQYKEIVFTFCQDLIQKSNKVPANYISQINKSISDIIVKIIVDIISKGILSPTGYGMSTIQNNITMKIGEACQESYLIQSVQEGITICNNISDLPKPKQNNDEKKEYVKKIQNLKQLTINEEFEAFSIKFQQQISSISEKIYQVFLFLQKNNFNLYKIINQALIPDIAISSPSKISYILLRIIQIIITIILKTFIKSLIIILKLIMYRDFNSLSEISSLIDSEINFAIDNETKSLTSNKIVNITPIQLKRQIKSIFNKSIFIMIILFILYLYFEIPMLIEYVCMKVVTLFFILQIINKCKEDKKLITKIKLKQMANEDLKEQELVSYKMYLKYNNSDDIFFKLHESINNIIKSYFLKQKLKNTMQLTYFMIRMVSELVKIYKQYAIYKASQVSHFKAIMKIISTGILKFFSWISLKIQYHYNKRLEKRQYQLSGCKEDKKDQNIEKELIQRKGIPNQVQFINLQRKTKLLILLLSINDFFAKNLKYFFIDTIIFYQKIFLFQEDQLFITLSVFWQKIITILVISSLILTYKIYATLLVLYIISNFIRKYMKN